MSGLQPTLATITPSRSGVLTRAMLVAVASVAVMAGIAGCNVPFVQAGNHRSACASQVAGLRNDSQVTTYEQPLAGACTSYGEFTSAYDTTKHESAVAPFVALVFCSPYSESTTPAEVYDSTLCTSARTDDPQFSQIH